MKIENDIMPPTYRKTRSVYPWRDMKVGDSIFFKDCGINSRPRYAATKFAARNGLRFTCKTVEGGIRIWRVE